MFEEQEAKVDKEATPQTSISSLPPDEMTMPPQPSMADNFQQFQDLIKRLADTLQTPLKEVKDL